MKEASRSELDSTEAHLNVGLTTSMRTVRRYVLLGVGSFFLAWLLGGVGETQGLAGLVPYADIILSMGFVLALIGAVLARASLMQLIPVGIISGVGHFYKGQDHGTHLSSGWGLGLEHTPHIVLGLVLIGVATIIAAVLAFYNTRAKLPG